MILFPNAKINIGLHVLRKRADAYHDLDTVFYPIPFTDALEVAPGTAKEHLSFATSGLPIAASQNSNLCVTAYNILKQDFPGIPPLSMHLHKVIPMGAGLGGGSSDGAHALLLLNNYCNLNLSFANLNQYALQLGSDCPFFIYNNPAAAAGRGEQLTPLPLSLAGYRVVLVFPSIHINTSTAFQQIAPNEDRPKLQELVALPVAEWRSTITNDFEEAATRQHPELGTIKQQLYAAGASYASMTGSGSTFFGLFPEPESPDLSFPAHYFVRHFLLPAQAVPRGPVHQ